MWCTGRGCGNRCKSRALTGHPASSVAIAMTVYALDGASFKGRLRNEVAWHASWRRRGQVVGGGGTGFVGI